MNNFLKNKHLASRAGFGVHHNNIEKLKSSNQKKLYEQLKSTSNYKPIEIEAYKISYAQYQEMSKATDKKPVNLYNKNHNAAIGKAWQDLMINSPNQLQEKMALFWHGHFATRIQQSLFNVDIINIFRKNALGSFRDLVFEVSKSPAMLNFLNNQQNKKAKANENFARELMELFTVGRGNLYTEKDIKESARAFTGWSYDENGEFRENLKQHDSGEKEFLGKRGNFTGTDIINMILEKPECAEFITRKIYKYLVNETPEEKLIKSLSQKFSESDYQILTLLDEIFLSNWFYSENNIGARVKSPIDLIVGIRRIMPMDTKDGNMIYNFERLLGQHLLQPPNVAGWPSGTEWIDSSTLLLRMKIPSVMAGYKTLDVEPKPNDDVNMGRGENKVVVNKNQNKISIHWESISNILDEDLFSLLLPNPTEKLRNMINEFNTDKSKQHLMISIMSTPEYQLC
ncbi:DUF1800 domain-containing protein [Epilithonimonas lactis]|uniref:DUF1800 domain-containing protein n=1 Tax=Epilithonimonas lactis TaxID=421072 RepID=A0A085BI34_9FLAO|nr:DUF1800 domain-containing protein [Epilithonimonas lactis]KFC22129.1 hypothetical protein IO89_09215 [Epilithonimonas lactis]SEQ55388.1 Uncharacterized conserved protein, DUF1800 family [Epilithonimonas lactis]